ncbi:MAG: glycosyltransferase family A protein [Rhodovibrio sp.]|nr:glycosyltransferase family A protein [Rhodovibrio sp.]
MIIPTCDRPEMLADALASVRAQTRPADEVIVVDNGTVPVADRLLADHGDLRVERIPPRSGASFARNWGAWTARCEALAFLDDDDLWPADYLARMLACLTTTQSALVAAPQRLADTLEETERPLPTGADGRFPRWTRLGYRGSNMVVVSRAFWSVNGFPTRMLTGEDRAFAIMLAGAGHRVSVCAETHCLKREHAGTQLTDRSTLALGKLCFLNEFGSQMDRRDVREDRLAVLLSLSRTWGWPLWLVGAVMAPAAALRRASKYIPGARARREAARSAKVLS